MSETTRPEWASGPEWDGWTLDDGAGVLAMVRNVKGGHEIGILADGFCVSNSIGEVGIDATPALALVAANAIADAAGGWA